MLMTLPSVGLHDLSLFVPETSLDLQTLILERVKADPQLQVHLERALKTTGQSALRFPLPWEDSTTLAAEACRVLLTQNAVDPTSVRFLSLGTETSVDMSKAGSSYVLGLMQKSGLALPASLATFQVQHACAGGTLAMLTIAGFLQAAGKDSDTGIVLTGDVARYQAPSTAEVTQGAGASALLLGRQPRLLSFDLDTTGFFSKDVDDFFRPLGSTIAKVKGGFSVLCYYEALIGAFEDHCARAGVSPAEELKSIDLFVLHVPYAQMPVGAMEKLLHKHLGLNQAQSREFLEERGFFAGLEPTSQIGNLYTGSLYLSLAYSLQERLHHFGPGLTGKKVMLASYGSGNTMSVLTGRIQPSAAQVMASWNLDRLLHHYQTSSWATYLDWIALDRTSATYPQILADNPVLPGRYYLARIREDGYREYAVG